MGEGELGVAKKDGGVGGEEGKRIKGGTTAVSHEAQACAHTCTHKLIHTPRVK